MTDSRETSEPEVRVNGGELELRSEPERIVSYRLLSWGELGSTAEGWETFERGAFEGTDPARVYLRLDHQDPALGRGLSLEEREDAAYMEFRIAQTPRGDELLGLIKDGIYRGASVGFVPQAGGTRESRHKDGRKLYTRSRVSLQEVGATWRPTFSTAEVLSTRSADDMTEPTAEAQAQAQAAPAAAIPGDLLDRLMTRLEGLEERSRQAATGSPPAMSSEAPHFGEWASVALRQMAGQPVSDLELRALAEIVTTTNMGVVPPAYSSELIGPIDKARPFLETTRQLPKPSSGTALIVPRIVTRPTVGVQVAEKDELTSTNTAIDTVSFAMLTLGGAGNLSLQLLARSDPSFLELYVRLLASDMAHKSDYHGLVALLRAGIDDGGVFDPESPAFGAAYSNTTAALGSPPDRIWMSSAAYAAFVDAKEPAGGGGRPLYPGLAGISNVSAGGPGGPDNTSLRPVIVPQLDVLKAGALPSGVTEVPEIIVGPAEGFGWAEDGSYQLQADNPAQAGRDVALVSMFWFAPTHPGAFTGYTLS